MTDQKLPPVLTSREASEARVWEQVFDRLLPSLELTPAKAHTCKCGAVIDADEDSCQGCRNETNGEHEQEIDCMFPSREP